MWTRCPQVLDEPVRILGLAPEDFALAAFTPFLASAVFDTLGSFACAGGVGAICHFGKRNKPPGVLLHTLHAWELIRLPGVLSPRRTRYSPW